MIRFILALAQLSSTNGYDHFLSANVGGQSELPRSTSLRNLMQKEMHDVHAQSPEPYFGKEGTTLELTVEGVPLVAGAEIDLIFSPRISPLNVSDFDLKQLAGTPTTLQILGLPFSAY